MAQISNGLRLPAVGIDVYVNVNQNSRMPSEAEVRADRTSEQTSARTWTVGELAVDLGVTTRTLRFYEAEGLLSPDRAGGNRVYRPRDRARLRLILRGRRFGMTLAECREIVDMYDGAGSSERRQLTTLLGRLDEIAQDLRNREADLRRTLTEVSDVAARCRARLSELDASRSNPRHSAATRPSAAET
jgi:DNA-binding transcriptional MerR regulator